MERCQLLCTLPVMTVETAYYCWFGSFYTPRTACCCPYYCCSHTLHLPPGLLTHTAALHRLLPAGGVLLHHIPAILAACLPLAGEHAIAHAQQPQQAQSPEDPNEDHRCAAAANAVLAVALACEEDVQHVLVAELLRALETGGVAGLGAATLLAQVASRTDLAQHVDALLAVRVSPCVSQSPQLPRFSFPSCLLSY
jgi:hypothetical protein